MGTGLEENKAFLLLNDLEDSRPWQAWVGDTQITQENGTNPRIRQMGIKEFNEYAIAQLTDKSRMYEIRIVQSDDLKPLVDPTLPWFLSFDEGTTKIPVQCLEVRESTQQGLSWKVIVSR